MDTETLTSIRKSVELGDYSGARDLMKPLLVKREVAKHPEALFLLGRTFFDADKATARYLFEAALALQPDYQEAGQYEARCGSSLGDLESFADDRHPACPTCKLRYRDHEPFCPYCGSSMEPAAATGGAFEEQLKEVGKDVIDAFMEFSEREDVKAAKEKITAAGKQAYVKAKEFGESEQAQDLKATAKAIGIVAARKAKAIGARKDVQAVKEKATTMGHDAAEKAKAFSEREDVKEAVEKAGETSKNILMRIARYAGEEIARIRDSEGPLRAWLIGKWLVIVLVVLLTINWIFGDWLD